MKIIIFSILFTVQAQYIDDDLARQSDINQMDFSTNIPEIMSSGGTSESLFSSFSSISDLDLTTSPDETEIIIEEQWFNVNQTYRRDSSYRPFLSWKRPTDRSWRGTSYILRSDPRCIRQMCSVRLKYNGTLSSRISGCLSFSLRTRGQPVGQLWIIENQELENTSQKIQLINNKTLRIEHSLRRGIKNLSIETQILFRNPQIDTLTLSNLNVNWRGPCPKSRRIPTPSPARRATLEDEFLTLSSEATDYTFDSNQQDLIYDTTTVASRKKPTTKRPFSFVNQKNFGWFLSLIALFCVFILASAVGHSMWLIRRYHHFTWHIAYNTPIQFLARRSIRSSTRSENKIATISEIATASQIATISQIAYDILNNDLQKEQTDISTTSSDRSTPMSYYTYL